MRTNTHHNAQTSQGVRAIDSQAAWQHACGRLKGNLQLSLIMQNCYSPLAVSPATCAPHPCEGGHPRAPSERGPAPACPTQPVRPCRKPSRKPSIQQQNACRQATCAPGQHQHLLGDCCWNAVQSMQSSASGRTVERTYEHPISKPCRRLPFVCYTF
jgi:hypothetical protein